jgi:hypothetical protein
MFYCPRTGLLFTVVVGPNSALEPAEAVLTETNITASIGPPVVCTLQRWGRPWLVVGAGGCWYPRGDALQRRGAYMQ